MKLPTAHDIQQAAKTLASDIIRTPIIHAPLLSALFDADIRLKLENMQYTSSFKARGAALAMMALSDEEKRCGVVTMSAGNHAQAVAFRAQQMDIEATIVMPEQTPFAKVERTRAFGGNVLQTGRNLNECEQTVNEIIAKTGAVLIHPYDNWHVVCGQGTVGLEMLADCPDLDCLVVPIGGGGLIGGISIIAKQLNPEIEIIGVEAELYASMTKLLAGQTPSCGGETLAEGIAVKSPGELNISIARQYVDDIIQVNEAALEWAVGALVEQQRIVSEGAGAAGIAAIYSQPERFKGRKTGVVICGGNIDTRLLSSILNRNMFSDGRMVKIRIDISDEPGMLASISEAIGSCGGNIVEIYHQRMFHTVPAKLAKIDAVVDTRGKDHVNEIMSALSQRGFSVCILDETA